MIAGDAMKIAIVRQRYNAFGGAERFVERAIQALVAQGADVSLIAREWSGQPGDGVKQITVNPPFRNWLNTRLSRDQSFSAAVQQILARGEFDLVQSHERIPGCHIFRAGDGVHAAWLDHRSRVLNRFQRWWQQRSGFHRYLVDTEKAMFSHPDLQKVICNSKMVRDEIRRYFAVPESKLAVIYNGVDLDYFSPDLAPAHRNTMRQQLGIPAATPLILYVGSGFERKGVPQLIRAFAQIDTDAHLIVIGADRKLKQAKTLADRLNAGSRITFTGPLQDVRPYLGAADAFALPTLYDPFPNAALEALASGLPTLTSPTSGTAELITDGSNGVVCDPLDHAGMVRGLEQLMTLGASPAAHLAARQSVEHLSLASMAAALINLYRELKQTHAA